MGKVISYSQYKMWATCPLQWKLAYVDGLAPEDKTIHHVFGSAMHDVIQMWLDILYNKSRLMARTVDLTGSLKEAMKKRFTETIHEENGVKVFVTDKNTMVEFYNDGVEIIKFLQTHVQDFFPTDQWALEGVEVPLRIPVVGDLVFVAYLDIILRHKLTGAIKIIDLKTSTKGWNKWKKDDKVTTNQLLVYKRYYAQQFKVSEDSIGVEFHILKRKLYEQSDFPQKRITKFEPSQGKISMGRAKNDFDAFITECFDEHGKYKTDTIKPTPSKSACRFCPFNNKKELCAVSAWKGEV